MTISPTILPFKLSETKDSISAHAGLALFGEFLHGLGLPYLIDRYLPAPGSARGYQASSYVMSLLLMLHGGGRSLEDLRVLREDMSLRKILMMNVFPSSDATGEWLLRTGLGKGAEGLDVSNRTIFRRALRADSRNDYTLDIDATGIEAGKRSAHYTYKGFKGYMPIVGHVAEPGLIAGYEFREGNTAPASRNLEFLQACEANFPKGKRISAIRADSAAYQADIFNWCEETNKSFAIGANLDSSVRELIRLIPESDWKVFRGDEIAETLHTMNATRQAFRLIVTRSPQQADLLDETIGHWRYHVIASNRKDEDAATTKEWYCKRGDCSENRIKDIKTGFGMERMPCGTFEANRVFFAVGVMAYNLYLWFRQVGLDEGFHKAQVQTVRWQLYNIAGKIVQHGRQTTLKIAETALKMFQNIRDRFTEFFRKEEIFLKQADVG